MDSDRSKDPHSLFQVELIYWYKPFELKYSKSPRIKDQKSERFYIPELFLVCTYKHDSGIRVFIYQNYYILSFFWYVIKPSAVLVLYIYKLHRCSRASFRTTGSA